MTADELEGHTLKFEDRDGYLYAFMTGRREGVQEAIEYWQAILEECRKRKFHLLLVEQDFRKPLSIVGAFTMLVEVIRYNTLSLKVAFVDRDLSQTPINLFAETVAVNRGITAKVFPDVEEAIRWIHSRA